MQEDTAEAGRAQQGVGEQLVRAIDLDTGQVVDLPASEAAEIVVLDGLKPTGSDGWLFTPSVARKLGFGRNPFREYPALQDPRLVQLLGVNPWAKKDGVWAVDVLRADGVPQCLYLSCLTDALDPIFDDLAELDRQQLAAPFLTTQAAA